MTIAGFNPGLDSLEAIDRADSAAIQLTNQHQKLSPKNSSYFCFPSSATDFGSILFFSSSATRSPSKVARIVSV
jgi:hypothetical protein